MEEKKNAGLIWLIVVLIILFAGLVSLVVYKTLEKDNENITDSSTTTSTTTTTEKIESNNNEHTNYNKKDIALDFQKENENNVMKVGFGLMEQLTEDKYEVNLTINNIKVNKKNHDIKIKNYKVFDYDCEQGVDKVVYFDDELIYEPLGEGCYLTSLSEIITFKDNYIVLRFSSEGGGWFKVYDSEGNEIKSKEDNNISVAEFKSVDEETINFVSYEYDENSYESKCRPNEYEMTIENNIIKYTLVKTGEYVECM